jgi:nitrogen regulatory protein PII
MNQGGKLGNLKKNGVPIMGVSEVRWKGREIHSGDYTIYCSGVEKSERGVAIVVHKSIVGSVVKKIVCNDRIIAVKRRTGKCFDSVSVCANIRLRK